MLGDAGRAAAARALGDAFADDPVMGWVGGFDESARRMTLAMEAAITRRFRRGTPLVFTTEGHAANAIWDAPDDRRPSGGELIRSAVPLARAFRFGLGRMNQLMAVTLPNHPAEPHYYLFAIGVQRTHQGQGLGSILMQPMLDRCDDEGVGAYLENSNPRNEAFYVRHGFESLAPLPVPPGCPPLTPMWRRPR